MKWMSLVAMDKPHLASWALTKQGVNVLSYGGLGDLYFYVAQVDSTASLTAVLVMHNGQGLYLQALYAAGSVLLFPSQRSDGTTHLALVGIITLIPIQWD
jgi:hypothetical protein